MRGLIESSLTYDQDVAKYCADVEMNILLPGCLGNHIIIVTRALDLMDKRCSTVEVKRIHKIILHESLKYNSDEVIDLVFRVAHFDDADVLKAITLSCEYGSNKTLGYLLSNYPRDSSTSSSCGTRRFSNFIRPSVGRPQGGRLLLEKINYGLYIAAFHGHAEVVETLIREDGYVNAAFEVKPQDPYEEAPNDTSSTGNERDRIYQTALQAALSGFAPRLQVVLTPRHNWDYRMSASEERAGREATVLLLLEHGANANGSNKGSDHLLSVTIKHYSDKIIQSMITNSTSLMNTHSGSMLAFQFAASRELGAAAVLKILLQAGGYQVESGPSKNPLPDNSDLNPIFDSALNFFKASRFQDGLFREFEPVQDVLYNGPGAVVKMLLQLLPMKKVEDDRYGLLLQMAVSIDDRDWTNFLFERGVNLNAQGYYYGTALQCAARYGNLELVQLLLSLGAEVNIPKGEHGSALRAAVLGGHEKVVDVLLQHGADVNLFSSQHGYSSRNSRPILQLALESPSVAILKSLIAAGADLNAEFIDKPPLLITACGLGDVAIVRLFLEKKININSNGMKSFHQDVSKAASALHMACSEGHEDIVRVLLEHGAKVQLEVESIDVQKFYSQTPLQIAAHAGHLSIVQLLINAGATIDHFNSHGTALSIASTMNRIEVVEELLISQSDHL